MLNESENAVSLRRSISPGPPPSGTCAPTASRRPNAILPGHGPRPPRSRRMRAEKRHQVPALDPGGRLRPPRDHGEGRRQRSGAGPRHLVRADVRGPEVLCLGLRSLHAARGPGATEMRGADFEAENHRLARTYALIRPNGPAWLAAWQAGRGLGLAAETLRMGAGGPPVSYPSTLEHHRHDGQDPDHDHRRRAGRHAGPLRAPGTWTRDGIAKDAAGRRCPPTAPRRWPGPWRVPWSASSGIGRASRTGSA